jgi:diguanylate cyclase (GGDEF)-like protein
MLAFESGFATAYEPVATIQSLIAAIGLASAGFLLSLREGHWATVSGGSVLGLSIGVMHHIGMEALVVPGTLQFDPQLLAASWIVGSSFAVSSLAFFQTWPNWRGMVGGALLLTFAICSLHVTAMSAITIIPDPSVAFEPSNFSRPMLAGTTAAVILIVLVPTLAAAAMQRTSLRCESVLRDQNFRFEAALRYLPVGFSMFDQQQKLVVCNGAYRNMYGLSEELTRPGIPFSDIMQQHAGSLDSGSLQDPGEWLAAHMERLAQGNAFVDQIELDDGRTILVRVGPVEGGGWVDVHEDTTERSLQEAKIAYMACHDSLTGLPNRALLQERLELALSKSAVGEIAILFMDLDRFKEVNDTHGHRVGDQLLVAVSQRLSACLRRTDLLARVGGDEFVLMLESTDPGTYAAELAARIIASIGEPYQIEGRELAVGISLGIAISDQEVDGDGLIARADLALYRSKSRERGTFSFFEEEMDTEARGRRILERDLQCALSNEELEVHYQPQLNIKSGKVVGFEALLRWRHPERGWISPATFIPIAEQTGLIHQIGDWILRSACAQAARWPDQIKVAVNVSPMQFRKGSVLQSVINGIAAAGISPNRLELEITESALMDDSEETLALLERLHAFGVKIAMDDFGTGYSSLAYLRKFPFDKIKIDRSFVSGVTNDESGLAIIRAVCGLGRSLGLATTAEGVETKDQLELVRHEGCTEAQGFLFGAAIEPEEIAAFLRRANRTEEAA